MWLDYLQPMIYRSCDHDVIQLLLKIALNLFFLYYLSNFRSVTQLKALNQTYILDF